MGIRPKKGINRRTAGGISEIDYIYFTAGDFFEAEGYAVNKTEAELRDFWRKNQAAIMSREMAENQLKGHASVRPWAWWKWSAPEPQQKTASGEFSAQRVWDHQRGCFDWVETDFLYLKRLNLLESWELGG